MVEVPGHRDANDRKGHREPHQQPLERSAVLAFLGASPDEYTVRGGVPESNLVESPEALLERLLPVRIKSESLGAVMEAEFGSVRVSYNRTRTT